MPSSRRRVMEELMGRLHWPDKSIGAAFAGTRPLYSRHRLRTTRHAQFRSVAQPPPAVKIARHSRGRPCYTAGFENLLLNFDMGTSTL